MTKSEEPIHENACHEGNYDAGNSNGTRAEEKMLEATKKWTELSSRLK